MENRNEKFRRLAQKRLSRVFATMSLIQNLSNERYYDYSDKEVDEMFEAYFNKGAEIREFFEGNTKKENLANVFNFNFESVIKSEKNTKFRELAESRLSRVFKDMNLIANLSNRNNYTYSDEEVEEMFEAYKIKGYETKGHFTINDKFSFIEM